MKSSAFRAGLRSTPLVVGANESEVWQSGGVITLPANMHCYRRLHRVTALLFMNFQILNSHATGQ